MENILATTKGHSSSSYRWDLWDHRPVKAFSVHFYGKFVQTDNRWASLFIKRSQGPVGSLLFKSAVIWIHRNSCSRRLYQSWIITGFTGYLEWVHRRFIEQCLGKNQTGLNDPRYSLLDSTGFLASQLIAILDVIICCLFWLNCLCIFVYWSNSTSYSYSSLLRYLYCLDLNEGSIAVVRLFTEFMADLYHCVLTLVIAIYSPITRGCTS